MTRVQLEILVHTTALKYGLDPALMCAIVEQESSWDTFAIRCESESGFMRRYGQAYVQLVKQSVSKNDDKWIVFEDLFYTSYGLMQTMYPVIIETFPDAAKALKFPTYLCKPEIGVEYGCRLFLKKLRTAGGNIEKTLLFWNGGGNPAYPGEVIAKRSKYVGTTQI